MGYYMGLFNFFVVIPQIVSGLLLGFFTKHLFGGHTVRHAGAGRRLHGAGGRVDAVRHATRRDEVSLRHQFARAVAIVRV